jgi:hypothetical protein
LYALVSFPYVLHPADGGGGGGGGGGERKVYKALCYITLSLSCSSLRVTGLVIL